MNNSFKKILQFLFELLKWSVLYFLLTLVEIGFVFLGYFLVHTTLGERLFILMVLEALVLLCVVIYLLNKMIRRTSLDRTTIVRVVIGTILQLIVWVLVLIYSLGWDNTHLFLEFLKNKFK